MQVKVAHVLVWLTVPIFHFSLCDIFTTRASTSDNSWIHLFLNFFIKSVSCKGFLTLRDIMTKIIGCEVASIVNFDIRRKTLVKYILVYKSQEDAQVTEFIFV
jgi:hypothetical protein